MPEWHHAPIHRLKETGAYSVTGATYLKQTFFHTRRRMDMLQDLFFSVMKDFGWWLQVWSLFPNHYHFVGFNEHNPTSLSRAIQEFHSASARELNQFEGRTTGLVPVLGHTADDSRLIPGSPAVRSGECGPPWPCDASSRLSMVLGQVVRAQRKPGIRKGSGENPD